MRLFSANSSATLCSVQLICCEQVFRLGFGSGTEADVRDGDFGEGQVSGEGQMSHMCVEVVKSDGRSLTADDRHGMSDALDVGTRRFHFRSSPTNFPRVIRARNAATSKSHAPHIATLPFGRVTGVANVQFVHRNVNCGPRLALSIK